MGTMAESPSAVRIQWPSQVRHSASLFVFRKDSLDSVVQIATTVRLTVRVLRSSAPHMLPAVPPAHLVPLASGLAHPCFPGSEPWSPGSARVSAWTPREKYSRTGTDGGRAGGQQDRELQPVALRTPELIHWDSGGQCARAPQGLPTKGRRGLGYLYPASATGRVLWGV